jgi:pimeloyl-ACP methyl ester carboxylesterase
LFKGGIVSTSVSRRAFLAGAGAVALGAACSSGDSRSERQEASSAGAPGAARHKTFVLLHGSWHGGWCWSRVAEPLRAQGHRVYTPTQTGLGERSHLLAKDITLETWVTDLVNVLEWEDLADAIVVGHSFAGSVITGAADRVPGRIGHLVYLDAVILRNGESAFSAFPPDVVAARRKLAEASGGVSVAPPDPSAFGVTDPADVAWLKAKLTPHPIATYETPLVLKDPVGNGKPVTYIAMKPDYAANAGSRAYAKAQPGWHYIELAGGHDAMLTSPLGLIDILLGV